MRKKIIGYDNEQKELKELGEMLVNFKKYREFGIRIPRGIVLYGAPGVGKTVMARSIALKGVETVELRAAECCRTDAEDRIHELFDYAKSHTPCVLILDELDKIAGMSRAFFIESNTDVNKVLLQELDKLDDNDAVLVVATCNDTVCLGNALLRPGRFDRQISVMRPDEATRKKIFKHYFSKLKFGNDVDMTYAAKITYGKSGADIECIVNESAIMAMHSGKDTISFEEVRSVINRMAFDGRPDEPLSDDDEALKVAVHEAGHALVALELLPESLHGASIIPQGESSGHVEFLQSEKVRLSLKEKEDEIAVALAGRVAERQILNEVFLGSENDLQKAVMISYSLLTKNSTHQYKFVSRALRHFDDSDLSEQSKYELECKLEEIMDNADKVAEDIITKKRELFDRIVEELLEKQFLSRDELIELSKVSVN